jgi:isopentenyl phosphate kinase
MDNSKELTKKIVVTGGGSGGHLSAAESIIKEISNKKNGGDAAFAAILFVRVVYVRGVEAIGAVVWAVIACTLLAVVIEGGKLFGS